MSPAPYTDPDCPAYAFDASLSIPSALCRPAPPAPAGPRPTPARPDAPPTLFRKES